MEKKYYDLIISLIKEHRKFADYENILEEIVNDVYEHSKVVIGSVTNEEVLNAYIKKVVSTSMITVPKKLNCKVQRVTKVLPTTTVEDLKTNTETIEETKELTIKEALENEEIEEVSELEETPTTLEIEEVQEASSQIEEASLVVEDEITDSLIDNESEDEDEILQEYDVDKTLVDKMINGVSEPVLTESSEESIDLVSETETEDLYEDLEEVYTEEESLIEEELDIDLELSEDENIIMSEDIENLEITEDEFEIESTEALGNIEEVQEALEENLDITEDILDTTELDEKNELTEEVSELEETSEKTANFYHNCFDFTPENIEYNTEEICSDIVSLAEKYPEKKIIEICDLKYTKKLSLSEIANELEKTSEEVAEVLTEIIEIVKD